MKKALVALMAAVLITPAVVADDLNPPPWVRETEYTTYQVWDDWDTIGGGAHFAEDLYTYPGATEGPWAYVGGSPAVWDDYDGRKALVITDGEPIDIQLPNCAEDQDRYKEIYLQIVWHWDGGVDIPELTWPTGYDPEILVMWQDLGDGWYYERYYWEIDEYNPDFELIRIEAVDFDNLVIDQIVIDTRRIPEPGMLSLLALGGLALVRRRR